MRVLIAFLALFASLSAARADVVVTVAPQGAASDFYFRSPSERDALFGEIVGLLRKLGAELPRDRLFKVELLDIRPAGRFNPVFGSTRPRLLTDVTPPSVKLRYALTERGRKLAGGEETVTDLDYLSDISARTSLSSFPYERALMRDWFRDRIVRLKPPLR